MKTFSVSCPSCNHEFEPIEAQSQFLAKQVESAIANSKTELALKQKELLDKEASLKNAEEHIASRVNAEVTAKVSEAEKKAQLEQSKKFEVKLKDLENQLNEKDTAAKEANKMQLELSRKLREANERQEKLSQEVDEQVNARLETELKTKLTEAQAKTKLEETKKFEIARRDLENQLSEKSLAVEQANEQQLKLAKQLREATERQQKMDIEIEQKVTERIGVITSEAQVNAEEQYKFKLMERDKKIKDIEQQLEAARRTAEQGSQQSQGEVVEMEFEKELSVKYPLDKFEPVPKGFDGADLLQTVVSNTGKKNGTIIWEFKNTKNFSAEWIAKLKKDQQQANADVAVLVTKTLPKGGQEVEMIDGVLVVSYALAIPVSGILRKSIEDLSYAQLVTQGQDEKMRMIYNYLTGNQFKTKITAIVSAFKSLKEDIETEKRAFKKMWASREKLLDHVIDSASSMYGDIEGIAGSAAPKIEALEIPAFAMIESSKAEVKE